MEVFSEHRGFTIRQTGVAQTHQGGDQAAQTLSIRAGRFRLMAQVGGIACIEDRITDGDHFIFGGVAEGGQLEAVRHRTPRQMITEQRDQRDHRQDVARWAVGEEIRPVIATGRRRADVATELANSVFQFGEDRAKEVGVRARAKIT